MTESQKLQVELSKSRTELNKLTLLDKPEDKQKERMVDLRSKVLPDLEDRWQKAVVTEDDTAPVEEKTGGEKDELDKLLERCTLTNMIDATAFGKGDQKLAAEVRAATGILDEQVPIEMLFDRTGSPTEQRSADPEVRVSTAPSTTPVNARPFLPYLFPRSAANFLGIAAEQVQPGQASFPRISGKQTAHRVAAGADTTASDPTFTSAELSAQRLTAQTTFRKEETTRWPGFEAALKQHIRDTLSDAMDILVLRGDTVGLEKSTALSTVAASAAFGYTDYLALIAGGVDGRYSYSAADIRTLSRPEAYQQAMAQVNAGSGETAVEAMIRLGAGFRVSANLSAKASEKVLAIQSKGSGRRNAVIAIWKGIEVVDDPYTKAGTGERILTVTMFSDFKIVDPNGFRRAEIQVA